MQVRKKGIVIDMVELLKNIRGYVRIRLSGFSPERFMNLCSNKGILLWDIVKDGDVYYMNINLKSFWQLRPIVKKTGTKVAVLERYGLPFLVPGILARKMFLAGLFLAVSFWIWSSAYIWDIEIEGNYQITDDMFATFLENQMVHVGMEKGSLDISELEKQIRREFTLITWASAKLSGTRLHIYIKENDAPILVSGEQREPGRDLISEYDGTVVAMIVRSGVPAVSIRDVVEKGALLVEGKVPIYNEDATVREYTYVDADADIILEHVLQFADQLPFDYIKQEYTGRESQSYYLRIGNGQWDIPGGSSFLVYDSIIKESRPLIFEKLSIPVYWGCITDREYMNVEYEYTLNEAETLLNQKLITFIESLEEKGVQIIEKNVRIDTDDSSWMIEGEFIVRELVGESVETVKIENGEVSADE